MRCDIEFHYYDDDDGVILFAEMAIFKEDFQEGFLRLRKFVEREQKFFHHQRIFLRMASMSL